MTPEAARALPRLFPAGRRARRGCRGAPAPGARRRATPAMPSRDCADASALAASGRRRRAVRSVIERRRRGSPRSAPLAGRPGVSGSRPSIASVQTASAPRRFLVWHPPRHRPPPCSVRRRRSASATRARTSAGMSWSASNAARRSRRSCSNRGVVATSVSSAQRCRGGVPRGHAALRARPLLQRRCLRPRRSPGARAGRLR